MKLRLLLASLAAVVIVAVSAAPASAHNVLRSTTPAQGETLSRTPRTVVLTFNGPAIAMGTQLLVTGPDGNVAVGAPQLVNDTVVQDVAPGAPAGRYTVTWRVTSIDGHPISGTFDFTSTAPATGSPPPAAGSAPNPSTPGAPAADSRGEPLIPSWAWIVAGVLVILGAVRVARRNRPG